MNAVANAPAFSAEKARFNMVEQQIRPAEVLDQDVLDLLFVVKREEFVPEQYRALAFSDTEIPLGRGAAMAPPRIEAHVLQAVQAKKHEKVLEVGAGSGYMAALLAAHADHVWTLEIDPDLADMARRNLQRQGIDNVTVEAANGAAGLPAHAPYDVIVVSGALPVLPEGLKEQLKVGGRLFAIVGEAPMMTAQLVTRVAADSFRTVSLFETLAAPLSQVAAPGKFVF